MQMEEDVTNYSVVVFDTSIQVFFISWWVHLYSHDLVGKKLIALMVRLKLLCIGFCR